MKIAVLILGVLMMLSGSVFAQYNRDHDKYRSFTHDARPTWYTVEDTIEHSASPTVFSDTFGVEIGTHLHIAGFQIDIMELADTAGGHAITTQLLIYGCATQYGSYAELADYHIGSSVDAYSHGTFMAHPGDQVIINYDVDCHSAAGLLGGPNKYRWYKLVYRNFGTGWGKETWRVSLLVRGDN